MTASDRTAVLVSALGLGAVSVLATSAVIFSGIIPSGQPEPAPIIDEGPQITTVTAQAPPSVSVPRALLNDPGEPMDPTGTISGAAPTPGPASCAEAEPTALVSLSRPMKIEGGGSVTVTVQSYAPGAGAAAFARGRDCAGVSPVADPLGAAQTRWPGGSSFRFGDLIVHVSGDGADAAAAALAQRASALLSDTCVQINSRETDYSRNPLSPDPAPYMVPETLKIEHPGEPEVPDGAQRTPVPAQLDQLQNVNPKPTPSWPVWPPMPEPVQRPEAPEVPAAQPVLTATHHNLTRDTRGPGCGWDWTGQSPSLFDEQGAQQKNQAGRQSVIAELQDGAQQWSSSVSTYFTQVAQYQQQAARFNAYAAEVEQVNLAWEVIAQDWEAYGDALSDWTQREREREQAEKDRTEAAESWVDALDQCRDEQSRPPEPSPTPEPTPTESASPTPEPTVEPEPIDCEIAHPRPAILDAPIPESLPEPTPPADPRPPNWDS